jgi:hypothetical protein
VLYDTISLNIVESEMFFGISEGDFGMFDTVVFMLRKIRDIMISPVIEEKIVKEPATGGGSVIELQKLACPV